MDQERKMSIIRTIASARKTKVPSNPPLFIQFVDGGALLKDKDGNTTPFFIPEEELWDPDDIMSWVVYLADLEWIGKETIRDLIQYALDYRNYLAVFAD